MKKEFSFWSEIWFLFAWQFDISSTKTVVLTMLTFTIEKYISSLRNFLHIIKRQRLCFIFARFLRLTILKKVIWPWNAIVVKMFKDVCFYLRSWHWNLWFIENEFRMDEILHFTRRVSNDLYILLCFGKSFSMYNIHKKVQIQSTVYVQDINKCKHLGLSSRCAWKIVSFRVVWKNIEKNRMDMPIKNVFVSNLFSFSHVKNANNSDWWKYEKFYRRNYFYIAN